MAQVPPDAVVSATHDLVPFLANRDAIYMFPNPWQATYWGIAGENQPSPATVEMLVLDTGALAPELRRFARRLAHDGTWEIITDDQEVLVARRRDSAAQRHWMRPPIKAVRRRKPEFSNWKKPICSICSVFFLTREAAMCRMTCIRTRSVTVLRGARC